MKKARGIDLGFGHQTCEGTGELAGPPRLYDVGTYKVSLLAGNALKADTASPRGRLQLAPLGKDHCSVLSLQPSPPLAPGLRETQAGCRWLRRVLG